MKKLLFTLLLLPSMVFAAPVTINFSKSLQVSRSQVNPGCRISTAGYDFDVTMSGYNLIKSTCTATNLFPVSGYLTTGQRAPNGSGQLWLSPAIANTTFSLLGFTIKNYGVLKGNTLYLDTTTTIDGAEVTTTVAIPDSTASISFEPTAHANLTKVSIRSTNNRFDITNIIVQ